VRFFDQTNVELTALYDREAQARASNEPYALEAARLGHLWMLRQDLAAYVLLGDPAVRLPSPEAAEAQAPRAIEVRAPRPAPTAAASVDTAPARPVDAVAARPVDTAPARPVDTAPARPVDTAPARPVDTAPARPVDTAPAIKTIDAVAAAPVDMFPAPGDAPAPSIALEILEEALAQVVLGERALAALAARAGVTREELARRVAAYREAGRRSS
jgi:hypothetical protein